MALQGKLFGNATATLAMIRNQLCDGGVTVWDEQTATQLDFIIAYIDASSFALDEQGEFVNLSQLTAKSMTQLFQQNLTNLLSVLQDTAQALKVRGGNIVIIGTLHGLKLLPSPPHFAAVQAALLGITQSLAKELGEYNIRVNLLACGLVDDVTTQNLCIKHRQTYLQHCALGRFARADEIARVANWFAIHNRYVSGQSIVVDGGL